jgi:hypothetical protein
MLSWRSCASGKDIFALLVLRASDTMRHRRQVMECRVLIGYLRIELKFVPHQVKTLLLAVWPAFFNGSRGWWEQRPRERYRIPTMLPQRNLTRLRIGPIAAAASRGSKPLSELD